MIEDKKIDYLRQVIRNRPVAILMGGPSLLFLEERIQELKNVDICFASSNDFWVIEQGVLSQIEKQLAMVICSAKECNVPQPIHLDFLIRPDKNIFITERVSYHEDNLPYKNFVDLFDEKLLFFVADRRVDALKRPTKEEPLHFLAQASFSILIALSIIGLAREIYLFGTSGTVPAGTPPILRYPGWTIPDHAEQRVTQDTFTFNKSMPTILKNIYQAWDVPKVDIHVVDLESHLQTFPKMSYDSAISRLNVQQNRISTG